MKTEELEQSLRAEFEGQMKNAIAKMRDDVAGLQKNYESEFEKHREQMEEAFKALSGRLDEPFEFDPAFSESVTEHLRQARDEGALVTATAMGEAEKLGNGDADLEFGKLCNAINEIKSNSTQAAILRSLVDAAANFAPRGAFFISKNEYLVGWKAFGSGELPDENVVRSVHFPITENTLVTNAVSSLAVSSGNFSDQPDNAKFLGPLSFGAPNRMVAIPLVARGRGVAVLYADGGEAEEKLNLDALETLVSVAGLRVELLASAAAPATVEPASPVVEEVTEVAALEPVTEQLYDVPNAELVEEPYSEPAEFESAVDQEYVGEVEVAEVSDFEAEPVADEDQRDLAEPSTEFVPVEDAAVFEESIAEQDQSDHSEQSAEFVAVEEASAYEEPEPAEEVSSVPEPQVQEQQDARSYRERTVDLPIEVSEDERRPHSDARRFARLLVSEIRLYNEQKVVEGRESGDIYEMLKEAIDRSREMYEKRVQPDVAAKFDYFHYELVNNLAEGDEEKLGAGYFAVKA